MHTTISHKIIIPVCCLALVCLSACVQQQSVTKKSQAFHEFQLNNGIKVFVRQNPVNRMHSIVLNINGGAGTVDPSKAGLDKITMQLLCKASKNYPDSKRREILKRTSSTITSQANLDFSTVQLKTIDTHFAQTFDLFLDLILQPTFPRELFQETITNAINAYRSDLTDGYARASRIANRSFFAGHPYASYLDTPSTLSGLSLQDVQSFYRQTFVAQRLTVLAAGNFNLGALEERLNATLGSLPKGFNAPAAAKRFRHKEPTRLLLDSNKQLNPDVSYLRGNFAIASPNQSDYWPLKLAGKLLSDIMHDLLRTRNGLVYSTWTAMFNKKANYGTLSAYRTSDPVKAIELITGAIGVVAQGKCVSPYSQKNIPGTYIEIEKALGFYKTSFKTKYYAGLQDSAAIALRMTEAYNNYGDCRQFLHTIDKIDQTSARDIVRVVKRYLKKGSLTWGLSAHPDTIETIKKNKNPAVPAYESIRLE